MATLKPSATFICRSCRHNLFTKPRRQFSTTPRVRAEEDFSALFTQPTQNTRPRQQPYPRRGNENTPGAISAALDAQLEDSSLLSPEFHRNTEESAASKEPHRLHIYAHKHNTHITFVQPSRPASQTPHIRSTLTSKTPAAQANKPITVLLSLSTGNLGFKKAGRGSYDAAFQLAAFALRQIQEKGMGREVKHLEVVLRGFGAGREAVMKALMGSEGRNLRGKIVAVADATRLKQGAPRGKKPRRLG